MELKKVNKSGNKRWENFVCIVTLLFFRKLYHKEKQAGPRAGRTKDHILCSIGYVDARKPEFIRIVRSVNVMGVILASGRETRLVGVCAFFS